MRAGDPPPGAALVPPNVDSGFRRVPDERSRVGFKREDRDGVL